MAAGERRRERMGMADRANALSYVVSPLQGYEVMPPRWGLDYIQFIFYA